MRHITHTWAAMAALGAALIHLAVAAGSPLAFLIPFTLVGVAQLAWAVLAMARSRYPLPRLYPVLVLAPLAVWAVAVFARVDSAAVPPMSMAIAAALGIVSAILVAVENRRGTASESTIEPSSGRLLAGFLVGAFAMAAVALPALGQTAPGIAASKGPHAHHTTVDVPDGHAGH